LIANNSFWYFSLKLIGGTLDDWLLMIFLTAFTRWYAAALRFSLTSYLCFAAS